MARKKTPAKVKYDVHPAVAYVQSIINNLPEKTGRSLKEWIKVIESRGPNGEKERKEWLKKEHKLGGTTASLIAEQAEGKDAHLASEKVYLKTAAEYVENMYTGGKAQLRPIHDALIDLGLSLGGDVKVCPCKTIVPLYRRHVFAEIKPATKTHIDFGLALKNAKKKPPQRLIDTGGAAKGDRITHRFALTSVDDIDDAVKQWLQIAYDLDV